LGAVTRTRLRHERARIDRGHHCDDRSVDGRSQSGLVHDDRCDGCRDHDVDAPMLRWALARLPISPEEAARLEREEFEAKGFVSNIERLLVAVDASPSGRFTSRLVGLLAGARRIATTVIHFDYATAGPSHEGTWQAERTKAVVKQSAVEGDDAGPERPAGDPAEIATRIEKPGEDVIGAEAQKGYGLLFIGREPASEGDTFHEQITRSAIEFAGPFAIVIARGIDRRETPGAPLRILVPVTGTTASRHGAELAIALAQASQGSVTALHVAREERRARSWQRHVGAALAPASSADAVIREIVRLGDHYGVEVKGAVRSVRTPQEAILRQLEVGGHNLLVMGVSPRPGDELFFGEVPAELLERSGCSVLFLASEPPTQEPEPRKGSVPASKVSVVNH